MPRKERKSKKLQGKFI